MTDNEIDCRMGALVTWAVDVTQFALPSPCSYTLSQAYPSSPGTSALYWSPVTPYLLWQELPVGYPRVLCGITIPAFSTDLSLAKEAAALFSFDSTGYTDPRKLCLDMLAAA